MTQIIYALVANGRFVLVSHLTKDGNHVQYSKRILASGVEEDGDHNRVYYDKSGEWVFHVLVLEGLTFLCFARQALSNAAALDFLNSCADSFFDLYADYLDDVDPEIFQDYQATLARLMGQFGTGVIGVELNVESMKGKPFCGMRDARGAILRTHTDVAIIVRGATMRAVVTCEYQNKTKEPKRVVFSFKQESGVTVGFQITREDQPELYTSTEELRNVSATHDRQFGFLLEEVDDYESFHACLGTVAPGEQVCATLTYVAFLEMESGALVLETGLTRHYGANLSFQTVIDLEMATQIIDVECPSNHQLSAVDLDGGRFGQVVVDPNSIDEMDSALTLFLVLQDSDQPMVVAERALEPSDPHAMSVCLGWSPAYQSQPFEDVSMEHIFICDRSDGMKGRKMKRLRAALRMWLHSLPPNSAFNIVGVGASIVKLFTKSELLSDATLRQALQHVASVEADLGAGDLVHVLRNCLETKAQDEGKPRQYYLVMSEGLRGNAETTMPLVYRLSANSRIFTFCIGPKSNQVLAKRIARGGNGICEYLPSDQNLEEAVIDRVHRGWNPVICVGVSWGDISADLVSQIPQQAPPVFYGSFNFFTVFAAFHSEPEGHLFQVGLKGYAPVCSADGMESRQAVQVTSPGLELAQVRQDNVISLNMLVHEIRLLEAVYRLNQALRTRAELLTLSIESNVAIDGVTECLLINAETNEFVEDCYVIPPSPSTVANAGEVEVKVVSKAKVEKAKPEKAAAGLFGRLASYLGNEKDKANDEDSLEPFLTPNPDELIDFLDLQRADGRWIYDSTFIDVVVNGGHLTSAQISTVPSSFRSVFKEATHQNDSWATVLSICILESIYQQEEQWWMLISLKARNWLFRVLQRNFEGSQIELIHEKADNLILVGTNVVEQQNGDTF